MLAIFEKASTNALSKFNNYGVNEPMHELFEEKLIAHIESKQQLLCSINKQKTIETLKAYFSQLPKNQEFDLTLATLRSFRRELDDGRAEAMNDILVELLGKEMGAQGQLIRKLDELGREQARLEAECQAAQERRNREESEIEKTTSQFNELRKQESQLDRDVGAMEEEVAGMKCKLSALQHGEGDAAEVEEMK
jgi:chromosome segregation ATPase